MRMQLSFEIMLGMSISVIIAALGYGIYLSTAHLSASYSANILKAANLTWYYSGIISSECRCN